MENLAIRLDKRIYTFLPNDQIKLSTVGKRIICSYDPYNKFSELFSTYSVCDPLLFFKNNEFWLAVSFDIPCPTLIENSCLGVDLGIKRLATTSEGLAFTDKKFLKAKRRLRHLKSILRSNAMTTKSRSASHKLKMLRRKEQNRNRNLSHHLANAILQTKSNVIVMEDLTGIKSKNRGRDFNNKQSQVPYFDLRRILTYKAPLNGKVVETVDPRNTSKDDHRGVERGKRFGCRYYASDGKVFDADWNASINIASKHSRRKEAKGCQLPVSFSLPIDGRLNLIGKPYQLANCEIRSRKPLGL
jgi:IS605 OrfB family transposase